MTGDLDRFGGVRALPGQATGFFHTQCLDGRWWLVTPEGHAFWSLGMDVLMLLDHYAPEHAAYCRQQYGSEEGFARHNIGRCRDLGFNSLGFWTTPSVRAEARRQQMPYFIDLRLIDLVLTAHGRPVMPRESRCARGGTAPASLPHWPIRSTLTGAPTWPRAARHLNPTTRT